MNPSAPVTRTRDTSTPFTRAEPLSMHAALVYGSRMLKVLRADSEGAQTVAKEKHLVSQASARLEFRGLLGSNEPFNTRRLSFVWDSLAVSSSSNRGNGILNTSRLSHKSGPDQVMDTVSS